MRGQFDAPPLLGVRQLIGNGLLEQIETNPTLRRYPHPQRRAVTRRLDAWRGVGTQINFVQNFDHRRGASADTFEHHLDFGATQIEIIGCRIEHVQQQSRILGFVQSRLKCGNQFRWQVADEPHRIADQYRVFARHVHSPQGRIQGGE